MTTTSPIILAIDTSCDDTSVAVVQGNRILSNVVASQTQLHKQYGGVFPTVAKQAHRENLLPCVQVALTRAKMNWADMTAIAVTQGPGLAPALEVGIEIAQQLAESHQLPLIPVNHIEGHLLSVVAQTPQQYLRKNLLSTIQFPVLGIIISGGHSEFILVKNFGQYERLGFTVDDAAGEALDKFGRMIGLGYPAGALVEEFATKGNHLGFPFPVPMVGSGNFNLSFSGLKTSVRNLIEQLEKTQQIDKQLTYDLCASFQFAVFRAITYKLEKILHTTPAHSVWLGGGVAANVKLRTMIRQTIKPFKLKLHVPYSKRLCSDNAAMIGVVASLKYNPAEQQKIIERKPNWQID